MVSADSSLNEGGGGAFASEFQKAIKRRRLVCLGGFPRNTDRSVITAEMEEIKISVPGIVATSVPGEYSTRGRLVFESNARAWDMMKQMRGRKFQATVNGANHILWHGFDKSPSEQMMTKRVSLVVKACKLMLTEAGVIQQGMDFDAIRKQILDADYDNGYIWLKRHEVGGTSSTRSVRVTVQTASSSSAELSQTRR